MSCIIMIRERRLGDGVFGEQGLEFDPLEN